jgi:hypothetical protein
MKWQVLAVLFLMFTPALSAEPCSTHQRKLAKPWTWMKSEMCEDDYSAWLAAHPAKRWYQSKQWWIGEAMMTGGIMADAWTTAHRCPGCIEKNFILGKNPSGPALWGLATVNFAAQTGLHWWSYNLGKNDPSKEWRFASLWAQPVGVGVMSGYVTYNNTQAGYVAQTKEWWIKEIKK